MTYFKQLDGLRFIAVVLTLIAHWFPAVGWPMIPYSWNGVDLFFAISGFLITTILLEEKTSSIHSKWIIYKNFAARRFLRLFPLYYLFLIAFFLLYKFGHLHLGNPDAYPYLFTYTANFFYHLSPFDINSNPPDGIFNHLWSLGVEEQFYIIWPIIILFTPTKRLPVIFSVIIIFSLFIVSFPAELSWVYVPFKSFSQLAAGAMLAYLLTNQEIQLLNKKRYSIFIFLLVLYLAIIIFYPNSPSFELVRESVLLLLCFSILLNTVFEWKGVSRFFKSPTVKHLGRISYGIYLIHMPIPAIVNLIERKIHIDIPPLFEISLYFCITIILANLSFKYIETPFLNLKSRFK